MAQMLERAPIYRGVLFDTPGLGLTPTFGPLLHVTVFCCTVMSWCSPDTPACYMIKT